MISALVACWFALQAPVPAPQAPSSKAPSSKAPSMGDFERIAQDRSFSAAWGKQVDAVMKGISDGDFAVARVAVAALQAEIDERKQKSAPELVPAWQWYVDNVAHLSARVDGLQAAFGRAESSVDGAWDAYRMLSDSPALLKPDATVLLARLTPLLAKDPAVQSVFEKNAPLPVRLSLQHSMCILDGKKAPFAPALLQKLVQGELDALSRQYGRPILRLVSEEEMTGALGLEVHGVLNTCADPPLSSRDKTTYSSSTIVPQCSEIRPRSGEQTLRFFGGGKTRDTCRVQAGGYGTKLQTVQKEAARTLARSLVIEALNVLLQETGNPSARWPARRGSMMKLGGAREELFMRELRELYDWGPTS